jgi:hypothetical protein
MTSTTRLFLALAAGLALGMSCSFTFRDDLVYSCATDADCGGGGFVCTSGACCKSAGTEVCGDTIDNDCDGLIDADDSSETEACNGVDDDCDGLTDEGFDFSVSPQHCGRCGNACDAAQRCNLGVCEARAEVDCGNGIDDDQNGQTDCVDQGCLLASCGMGCLCTGGVKLEQLCEDGADNDADGKADCADSDCDMKACGAGCACLSGARRETNCADGVDNDLDGGADCDDPTCETQFCLAGTTQRCMGTACLCNGGASVPEDGGATCADGLDNDCDNSIDCRDTGCDGLSCSPDGGADCACTNRLKAERTCTNRLDDDGDGLVDCADLMDCPAMTPCTARLGSVTLSGQCGMSGQCAVEFCFDGTDNDADSQADCADSDCTGLSCVGDGGVAPDGGPSCLCIGTSKREQNCRDRADNDGDGQNDCADALDCPQGTACTRPNNQAGTCSAGGSCN